jgi:hypothetical protein
MSSSHGSKATIFANGYELSQFLNSASPSGARDAAETSTFGNTSKTYIPGLKDTTLSIEGYYDGAVSAVDEVLSAALITTPTGLASYCPYGDNAVGDVVYTLLSIETSYEINTDVGDVAQISCEMQAGSNGRYARGNLLHLMQAEAAGGQSVSFDNGAQSTNGGGLVVQVSAATTLSIKLQDSADNLTWADVGSPIVTASGRAAVRLEVTGTIRRYTRVLWTGTGTFLAAVERY